VKFKCNNFFACFAAFVLCFGCDAETNSPSLIKAENNSGLTHTEIDFKTNGYYILSEKTFSIGKETYQGSYKKKGDTIIIDKIPSNSIIQSRKFIITIDSFENHILNQVSNTTNQIDTSLEKLWID
jgi:hypothetical protein